MDGKCLLNTKRCLACVSASAFVRFAYTCANYCCYIFQATQYRTRCLAPTANKRQYHQNKVSLLPVDGEQVDLPRSNTILVCFTVNHSASCIPKVARMECVRLFTVFIERFHWTLSLSVQAKWTGLILFLNRSSLDLKDSLKRGILPTYDFRAHKPFFCCSSVQTGIVYDLRIAILTLEFLSPKFGLKTIAFTISERCCSQSSKAYRYLLVATCDLRASLPLLRYK